MTTYSISGAAAKSGLSSKQIRYLEELGHIAPEYIKIGSICQRRYSLALIAQLAEIARLRQEGFELSSAVEKVKKGDYGNENKGV